jgi:hypothetical protein
LGRLMQFVCRETAIFPGELICVSTHADAELAGRKSQICTALAKIRQILIERDSKVVTPGER